MFWMLKLELNKVGFFFVIVCFCLHDANKITFLLEKTHEEIYFPTFGLFHET